MASLRSACGPVRGADVGACLAYHALMLFLVDGYNVTKSDPVTRGLDLEGQRHALVARLRARGREMLGVGRIVVVFDGEGGLGMSSATGAGSAPVEAVFSREQSADDLLVRIASGAAGESLCLVSSDVGLTERIRLQRAGRVEVRGREAAFESAGRGKARKGRARYPASSAGIPAGGNRITEELKGVWLAEEDGE